MYPNRRVPFSSLMKGRAECVPMRKVMAATGSLIIYLLDVTKKANEMLESLAKLLTLRVATVSSLSRDKHLCKKV